MERRDWLLAGTITGFALFAVLALDQAAQGPVYRLDFPVDAAMARLNATGWPIHAVGNVMSMPGSSAFAAPCLVAATALLWSWRRRNLAAWCLASGTLIGLLNPWLKGVFQRPLPPFIFSRFHSYAFPSGHTMGAAGTVGVAILLLAEGHITRQGLEEDAARRVRRRALAAWAVVSLVVGVGRILAQNHWLSDILAAWSVSVGLVCLTLLAARPGPAPQPRPAPPPPRPPARTLRTWAWVLGVALALFALVVADTLWRGPLSAHVIAFNDAIANLRDQGAPTVGWGVVLSQLGEADVDLFVVALGALACLLLGSPRRAVTLVAVALLGAWLIVALQDHFIGLNVQTVSQPTPTVAVHMGNQTLWLGGSPLVGPFPANASWGSFNAGGFSHLFPSGHTFGAALDFGLALVLTAEAWIDTSVLAPHPAHRLRAATVGLWALAVAACGLGRLLLRVHWYTDVLAGAALGAALVAAAVLLTHRPWRASAFS
jgi:membrane-associated phospholipid phosphatase